MDSTNVKVSYYGSSAYGNPTSFFITAVVGYTQKD